MKLALYRLPQDFCDFVGYLQARNVGAAVQARHASVAQKVLSYLETKEPWEYYEDFSTCIARCVAFSCDSC